MCRFAAYLGPSRPLSTLLYEPERSLEVLAYLPREMQSGTVNVDGTGVAWWPDPGGQPVRYVTAATPWADANLPSLAPRLSSGVQVAAVRSATPGLPFGPANVAPFVHGSDAFAHNGWLGGFRDGVGRALAARLPDEQHALMDTVSDSVTLFATFLSHRARGAGLVDAVSATVADAVEVCDKEGVEATLNLLVSDGRSVVAVRTSHGRPGNSLYTLRDTGPWEGGAVVASEPLAPDLDWSAVPDDHVVELTGDRTTVTPLTR